MAAVIHLDSERALRAHSRPPNGLPECSASAEIIIFPGIRYERWDGEEAPSVKKTQR